MMMNEYELLRQTLIEKGYAGEKSLPVLARMAKDPGAQYFAELKRDLRRLFDVLGDTETIDRELAAALFGLAHIAFTGFEAAIGHGVQLRDTLLDPDLVEIEMAVESIFTGEWVEL